MAHTDKGVGPCGCFLMDTTFAVCSPFSAKAETKAVISIAVNKSLFIMRVIMRAMENSTQTREMSAGSRCQLNPNVLSLA